MAYLLNMVIFHGYVSHNQMVSNNIYTVNSGDLPKKHGDFKGFNGDLTKKHGDFLILWDMR